VGNTITRDAEVMHGTPVFCGTRVPVQTLFDYLEGGKTLEDFLTGFPTVSRELAIEALEEAKQLLLTATNAGQNFRDLAERFRSATDPKEIERLGEQLGRVVFGG